LCVYSIGCIVLDILRSMLGGESNGNESKVVGAIGFESLSG
jgi:hypothetical protein